MPAKPRRSPASGRPRRTGYLALLLAASLPLLGCEESPADLQDPTPTEGSVEVRASVQSLTVSKIVVEVDAEDILDPLVFNLDLEGTDTDGDGVEDRFTASATLTLPAGSERTFAVRAFDTGDVLTHEGTATVDVLPGSNPSAVVLTLLPLAGEQPIEVVLGTFEVTVTPETAEIDAGATQQFTAEVTDPDGPVEGVSVLWATTNPGVATVDATGLATSVDEGTANIVATYGGVAGTAALSVGAPSEPPTGETEVCDGVDNDGDGQVDEGLQYCLDGEPAPNTDGESCDEGFFDVNDEPSDGCEATPEPEICDGIDNDLDGQVDEGFPYCADGMPAPNTDGETCDEGFFDANGDPSDGCEVEGPLAGDLVIDEIMMNPSGIADADGEWLELYNPSARDVDLRGTTVEIGAVSFVVDRSVPLPSGGFAVLARNGDPSVNGGIAVDFDYDDAVGLNDAGNQDVTIVAPDGSVVDVATTLTGMTEGIAQSLDPASANATDNDSAAAWCEATIVYDSTNGNLGTPGATNPGC